MSTWISKAIGAAALAACATGAQADVKVSPPPGYCVSPGGAASGTVLIGNCAAMRGRAAGRAAPAILTATLGPEGSALAIDPGGLQGFFTSEAGRAALSRSGRAGTVQVLQTAVIGGASGGDVFILRLRDAAPFPGGQVTAEYWRALLPLGDRMVTLSVLGLAAAPLSPEAGLDLLRAFVTSMRRANRGA